MLGWSHQPQLASVTDLTHLYTLFCSGTECRKGYNWGPHSECKRKKNTVRISGGLDPSAFSFSLRLNIYSTKKTERAFPPSLKVLGTASLQCFAVADPSPWIVFLLDIHLTCSSVSFRSLCSGPLSTRSSLTTVFKTAPCPALPNPPRMPTPWVEGLLSVLFGLYPQCSE